MPEAWSPPNKRPDQEGRENGEVQRHGTFKFNTQADAEQAVEVFDEREFQGRKLRAELAQDTTEKN